MAPAKFSFVPGLDAAGGEAWAERWAWPARGAPAGLAGQTQQVERGTLAGLGGEGGCWSGVRDIGKARGLWAGVRGIDRAVGREQHCKWVHKYRMQFGPP